MLQISRHYNVRYPNITVAIAPCIGWLPSDHLDHVMLLNRLTGSLLSVPREGRDSECKQTRISTQYTIQNKRLQVQIAIHWLNGYVILV